MKNTRWNICFVCPTSTWVLGFKLPKPTRREFTMRTELTSCQACWSLCVSFILTPVTPYVKVGSASFQAFSERFNCHFYVQLPRASVSMGCLGVCNVVRLHSRRRVGAITNWAITHRFPLVNSVIRALYSEVTGSYDQDPFVVVFSI